MSVQLLVTDRSGGLAAGSLSIRVRPDFQPARFSRVNILPDNSVLMGKRHADGNGRFTISDTTPGDTSRFYRAVLMTDTETCAA